jgi:hypothetical protein
MLDRIVGVFKLDVGTFEAIEHDPDATSQAAIVVLVVAVLAGLGSGFWALIGEDSFFGALVGGIIATFLGWIVWSVVTYIVGTSLFNGQADLGEMLRVIGFAYAPQFLGIIPCIGAIIGAIWSLIAGFIAVRQGLDLDNTNALLTIVIGFIGYLIVWSIIVAIFGLPFLIF